MLQSMCFYCVMIDQHSTALPRHSAHGSGKEHAQIPFPKVSISVALHHLLMREDALVCGCRVHLSSVANAHARARVRERPTLQKDWGMTGS